MTAMEIVPILANDGDVPASARDLFKSIRNRMTKDSKSGESAAAELIMENMKHDDAVILTKDILRLLDIVARYEDRI
jgi:hypothetical protein